MTKKKSENLEAKIEELTADLQRVHADFVNFRRRSDEERSTILDLARQDVVLQILPLIDNLDRALGHLPKDLAGNDWAKGVQQVARQAQDTLKRLGVEKIESAGQPFDPTLHEAVGGEGEVISEELQPGYRIGERVIRPAIVKVGKE